MLRRFRIIFLSHFLLITIFAQAQQADTEIKKLQHRVDKNKALFFTDPDKAFLNTETLLEEALRTNQFESEFYLLEHRCWYYRHTSDADNLLRTARILYEKADKHKNNLWKANALNYISSAYEFNQLYDKSVEGFNKAIAILEKEDGKNPDIITAKSNAFLSLAKVYLEQNKTKEALPYLLMVIREYEKLKDPISKKRALYINYANLAACYLQINLDSAEYYAEKSMRLKPEDASENDPVTFLNYSVLGDVQFYRKNYKEALVYYHQGEKILPENKNDLGNQKELYRGFYEAYQGLDDTVNANLYSLKLKEAELEISQNRNKSLLKIVEDTSKENNDKAWLIILSLSFVVVFVLIYRLKKKNRLLQEQEKRSREYLEEQQNTQPVVHDDKVFTELIEMVKSNDAAFLASFLEKFPGFSEKLQAVNSKIVLTEVEFCALLKLNLPTKDIARYKNIEPKSVQNKKYRVRKKLNIPDDVDIYFWFNKF